MTEESALQLIALRASDTCQFVSEMSRGESTGSRHHVDGANLQLQGQQGTGTWLPRYSHCLTSACCSGYEYGEHGEHSGQVR